MTRGYRQARRSEAADETRRRIVQATFELHAEQGIAATTMKQIAARAGVSVGSVYHHFPTYDDAINACGAHAFSAYPIPTPAIFEGAANRAERVRRLARALFRVFAGVKAFGSVIADQEKLPVLKPFVALEHQARLELATVAAPTPFTQLVTASEDQVQRIIELARQELRGYRAGGPTDAPPARPDHQAAESSLQSLGIPQAELFEALAWERQPRADPEADAQDLLHEVIEGAYLAKRESLEMPSKVRFRMRDDGTLASFSPLENTINVFLGDADRYDYWVDDSLVDDEERSGWRSTTDRAGIVLHEFGHAAHYYEIGYDRIMASMNDGWPALADNDALADAVGIAGLQGYLRAAALQQVAGQVSQYAATNPVEFVAEAFAGTVQGKRYGPAVYELYAALGGPVTNAIRAAWDDAKVRATMRQEPLEEAA